jgi:hypothetical protein
MSSAESDFLKHAAMVRDHASMTLSEADTRVHLIDPVLSLLGYRSVGDIRREVSVTATREFIDYELRAAGQPRALVEAKALRHAITEQHVAQCVQYATVLGVRWCLITNGTKWVIYDAHAKGPLPAKHVAEVRLDGDAKGALRAWSVLSLFSRESLAQSPPLTRLLVERVVVDEFNRLDGPVISALRKAVKERFGEVVPPQAILDALKLLIPTSTETDDEPEPQEEKGAAKQRRPRKQQSEARSGLAELIEAGLLPADAVLDCKLYGVTHTARIRDGEIELKGKRYATPSAAAVALRDGKATNGWVTWRYKGAFLADLREKLASQGNKSEAS